MGKMTLLLVMVSVTLLVFFFMGLIDENSTTSQIFQILKDPQNIKQLTPFLLSLQGIAAGTLFAGLVVVGVRTGQLELVAVAPLATFLLVILFDFLQIFVTIRANIGLPFAILFFSVSILITTTAVDWWRRHD